MTPDDFKDKIKERNKNLEDTAVDVTKSTEKTYNFGRNEIEQLKLRIFLKINLIDLEHFAHSDFSTGFK